MFRQVERAHIHTSRELIRDLREQISGTHGKADIENKVLSIVDLGEDRPHDVKS